jgi:hypothetical protein
VVRGSFLLDENIIVEHLTCHPEAIMFHANLVHCLQKFQKRPCRFRLRRSPSGVAPKHSKGGVVVKIRLRSPFDDHNTGWIPGMPETSPSFEASCSMQVCRVCCVHGKVLIPLPLLSLFAQEHFACRPYQFQKRGGYTG